jgi:hypothetical protein
MVEIEAVKTRIKIGRAQPLLRAIGILAALAICMTPARADQTAAPKRASTAAASSHKRAAKAPVPASHVSAVPPEPVAPKPPDWPANAEPSAATIEWNSRGLQINASNSSLQQILKDVATATGAKVSGLGADQRVFGSFGPGPARDVLSQLLVGSGYNVLMVGEQGQGTPREIVLSKQASGSSQRQTNSQSQNNDDSGANSDVDEQPQPPPPTQPQAPLQAPAPVNNNPSGFGPGGGQPQPRTPQQILQEMQQRQQQIEQLQQQQHNQQPQPPQ